MTQAKVEDNVIKLPSTGKTPTKETRGRWPQSVMAQGYNSIPTIMFWGQAKLGVTPEEFNVLLQIISHWWIPGKQPFLSKEDLAQRMSMHPRTAQIHIAKLEKKGLLRRVKRVRYKSGQAPNGFDLSGLVEKLEKMAPEFKKVSDQNKLRRHKAEQSLGAKEVT
jgi:DNA-binding CsgD family transcriptional regulator